MNLLPLSLLSALLACSGGPGDGPDKSGSSGPVTDPRPLVEVESVSRGTVSDLLISNGVVESEAQADLVPEATGTVVAIKAEEGDEVRKGQVLAILENASLDAGLARADAELARAQAELERVNGLHGKGAVSDRELQEAKYAERSAEVALKEARGIQGHTRIVSPIQGTVSIRELEYGEVAGGQRAFQVVDLSRLRVVIKLPERDLARLKVGQEASLVSLYDDETRVPGHVTRISPTVDAQTGTVRVTVALDDPEQTLRPGQFVSVRIEVNRHDDVLVLPRRAVFYEEGDPTVFVVTTDPAACEKEEAEESAEEESPKNRGWGT
ncbi:MAG: membrane fusion protein (multidrug efflux system), partial [Cognaticolwellia sp.]